MGSTANFLFPYHDSFLFCTRDPELYNEDEFIASPNPCKHIEKTEISPTLVTLTSPQTYIFYYTLIFILFRFHDINYYFALLLIVIPFLFNRYFENIKENQQAKRGRPKRIILIRHAESEGNRDSIVYQSVPDNKVKLTSLGEKQAILAGQKLQKLVGNETIHFFVSPYTRSKQTLVNIISGMNVPSKKYIISEDPRLREQDWGNFQNADVVQACTVERRKFGPFYFRFPNGESGSDVFVRITSFLSSINREFRSGKGYDNFVIVSHGITLRLLLMRYFKWTVEEFHLLWNFDNCQFAVMELQENNSYFLTTPLKRDTIHVM